MRRNGEGRSGWRCSWAHVAGACAPCGAFARDVYSLTYAERFASLRAFSRLVRGYAA
nr:MAG TPA: hypothetical protein [Caudoviricetes sp.]